MAKKSALEQALLESNEIVKVATHNVKDMLYAQLKPEIDKTIKESLELDDDDKDLDDAPSGEAAATDIAIDDKPEDAPSEITVDDKPEDTDVNIDSPLSDVPAADSGESAPEDDEIDLTGASDDEVIKVFKKLSDDSEIKIVKTEGGLEIEKDGEEFIVKLNETEDLNAMYNHKPSMAEDDKMSFVDSLEENSGEDDEIIYEIVMDEDDSTGVEAQGQSPETQDNEQPTLDEVARTHADGRHQLRKPKGFYDYASSRLRPALKEDAVIDKDVINEAVLLKETNGKLVNENESLKKDLEAHKNALRSLKENLMEVALVNSQMAYVNRLFTENATTLTEKKAIIDRFSSVKTIDESKTLFKTILNEMKTVKGSVQEEIEQKINTTVASTGEPLLEQENIVISESQQKIDRIKFLMGSGYYK